MLPSKLPSPGVLSNSQTLRHQAAIALSHVEIVAAMSPTSASASATQLKAFFTACAAACDAVIVTPPEEPED